jgi:hypothetical protein
VDWFHQALRFALFGGGGRLRSGEIVGGGEWLEGSVGRGLAEVRLPGCWVTLEDGLCDGVCICRGV